MADLKAQRAIGNEEEAKRKELEAKKKDKNIKSQGSNSISRTISK